MYPVILNMRERVGEIYGVQYTSLRNSDKLTSGRIVQYTANLEFMSTGFYLGFRVKI